MRLAARHMVRRIRTSPRMLANTTNFWHDVAPFHLAVLAKSAVQLFEHQRREMVTVYDSSLAPPPTDLVGANPVADEMQSKKGGHRQRKRNETTINYRKETTSYAESLR